MAEYEREFVRLSKHSREIVPTKADRCRRFEEGLNDNIKLHVKALMITNFSQLIEAVLNVKRVRISEHSQRDRQHKRESRLGQSSMPIASKKPKGSQN